MLDNVLVTNEVVDEVRCKKNKCTVVKAYYMKVYDLVRWEYDG